jgi:ribosomal protein S20
MALDPNIALGVRGIELPNQLAQYGQLAQIQNAQNQNALSQYQLGAAQRADVAAEGLNKLYAKHYDPVKGTINQNALMEEAATTPGLASQIPKLQELAVKREQETAALAETKSKTSERDFDQRIKKAKTAISDILALNSPEEAVASIDRHVANGDIDQQKADMLKSQLAQAPSFDAWQNKMMVGILGEKEKLERVKPKPVQVKRADGSIIFLDENPNSPTFQKEVMPAQAPGITPYEQGRLKYEGQRVGMEGQRVGLEGQRVALAKQAQSTEGLPPKEIQKREAALPQATSAIKGFENKSDSFVTDLVKLRDHPGLNQITGIAAGRLPAVTAAGRAAEALYDKVVAKGGFQALQDLRDASKTGGALGNVSNQEGKQLTAAFSAIQRTQDAKDVRAAIDQAIADVQGAKTRMREAYDSTYSYKSGNAPAAATGKWEVVK